MAKKAIGKVRTGQAQKMAQVIVPMKSPRSGAYVFQSSFLSSEEAAKLLAKHKK